MQGRFEALGLTPARLMLIAAGFVSVYFGFSIVGNYVHQYQLDRDRAQLRAQIQVEQTRYARLDALRQWMQSDAFIEAMARHDGLVKPGDHPIVVSAPAPSATPGAADDWWERYFGP
ncbi:MAG TPA: septum formation initiator family protein [Dehalococcoidia bacterium]|nr:septum formation initiator family protein [Dehalococcoidia bacterium]